MSFYDILKRYPDADMRAALENISDSDVERALQKERPGERDFLALLSDRADAYLEAIAQKAHELTLRNFGRVIHLYAPLYLSNFCDNECVYCGFKHSNPILRKKLSAAEVEQEAKVIAGSGILHVLLLTGESHKETPPDYIRQCLGILRQYFSPPWIETYPLDTEGYVGLVDEGADGLTIYQETYDEELYEKLHQRGFKRNFRFRLDAPERACQAWMRSVSIGALLGLSDFRKDVFFTGLHALYLQNRYPGVEIGVSFPRIQPQVGNFSPENPVNDREIVRAMLAVRLFMPRAGINISTRERGDFRRNLIGLGVTRMSAGSRTEVGGYALSVKTEGQFDVADTSGVDEIKEMISLRGYQPVMKDWQGWGIGTE
ncbi:MAG: 2-iminoacetate synthase ThiH [Syntrophales bacterium]|nr:2-iminoacetate synthase ThiH [Syntrophales bacterium]